MSTRFWIEFDRAPEAMRFGFHRFGVTAEDAEAALAQIRAQAFQGRGLPPVGRLVADVDVSTLDPENVQEMMGDPDRPGIWFPLGFQG